MVECHPHAYEIAGFHHVAGADRTTNRFRKRRRKFTDMISEHAVPQNTPRYGIDPPRIDQPLILLPPFPEEEALNMIQVTGETPNPKPQTPNWARGFGLPPISPQRHVA